jgi:hypothetical protein
MEFAREAGMRHNYLVFSFLSLVVGLFSPCPSDAQSSGYDQPKLKAPSPIRKQQPENASSPAVLLTPMKSDAPAGLALIDDVCVHRERRVKVYRLINAPVKEVANALNQWLKTKLGDSQAKLNGFICDAPVIMVPEEVNNSLVISMVHDFPHAAEIENIITSLDQASHNIRVQTVIRKTVNGVTEIVGKPSLVLRDNVAGSITFGSANERYTIEVVARVQPNERPATTILRSASEPRSERKTRQR